MKKGTAAAGKTVAATETAAAEEEAAARKKNTVMRMETAMIHKETTVEMAASKKKVTILLEDRAVTTEGEGCSTMEDTDIKTAMERRVMAEMVMEPARVTGGMENTKETIIEREMEKADGGMTKAEETEMGLMDSNAFVITRAAARELKRAEQERKQKQKECGVQPKPLEESQEDENMHELGNFDDTIFSVCREKQKKRSERRYERAEHGRRLNQVTNDLCITAEEFKELQQEDASLTAIRRAAKENTSGSGVKFFERSGLVYRRWAPHEEEETEQIVVPVKCRRELLRITHATPFAGHLGREKTTQRLLQLFYWPGIFRDVANYCRSCSACQKSSSKGRLRAPLVPLPIIATPFKRIAMDIVGPLPKSRSGKRYILVVCDYATRFPEAIALKSIDAARIAEELLKLFARVGIPDEILTDQGSNFTSQLLTEIYRMLHVHPIKTTPYHPQTDGLVERFNKTLKSILRKVVNKEGKDWHQLIPYLLFAYREVPQSSTGFSPFELLYGRTVKGLLDVIHGAWSTTEQADESIISHVLTMRERLEKMKDIVRENLEEAWRLQKKAYDRRTQECFFKEGDKVLVLLTHKLIAQWSDKV